MPKNILVITGSPRKDGNSELMADAFIRGSRSNGHEVTKFRAASKKIGGCRACNTCWSKGRACTFQDGFTQLEPLLEKADSIVFASPLYWFSLSAQIKAAIDRMNAYDAENCKKPLKIKESILLVCGANEGMDIFKGVIETYKSIANYMNWENAGIVAVPKVGTQKEVLKTDAVHTAEQLGKSL